ncbi:MAG: hypothetical protein M1312_02755 [Patescibacteria group bacterium]|nr:hypothetical protein [Patescibacteria group bacterium]
MRKDFVALGIWISVLVLIVVGIFLAFRTPYFSTNNTKTPSSNVGHDNSTYTPPKVGMVQPTIPITQQASVVVDITAAGFSPQVVTINVGQSVLWTNRDRTNHWIAPDPTDPYPSNGSCGSAFNSCQALQLGDSWKFTFTKTGTWDYYDKLNQKFVGEVIVQ